MQIAFLGPAGTFSEEAALKQAARDGASVKAYPSIPAVLAAVESGETDSAILPIENSLEGTVSTTVDWLIHDSQLKIRAELILPVRHFLAGVPGTKLEDLRTVTSHPQALGQSRRFIEQNLGEVEQIAALSTAASVETVMKQGDRSVAGIGTRRAAELFGAEVLADDIQDNDKNVTRFVVLSREDSPATGSDKTSICFEVKQNVPGALHHALSDVAEQNIQMTKVESRPQKSTLGDYFFLVDFEGHRTDPKIAKTLEKMGEKCAMLKLFGSYPRYDVAADNELESAR